MTRTQDHVRVGAPRHAVARFGGPRWFAALPTVAKAGVSAALLLVVSAGVLVGVPPSRIPWLAPTLAPQVTVQTPVAVKPSVVQAATPTGGTSASVRTVSTELARAAVSLSAAGRS